MNWGFFVFCALQFLGIGLDWARHGEEKTGKYNAVTTALGSGIAITLILWAMHWRIQ